MTDSVEATPRPGPWICCHCDAPLSCGACGVEQPDDSEYYRKLHEKYDSNLAEIAKLRKALEKLQKRADELSSWLTDECPYVAADQKHRRQRRLRRRRRRQRRQRRRANTPERAYWHYGYRAALIDALALLQPQGTAQDKERG